MKIKEIYQTENLLVHEWYINKIKAVIHFPTNTNFTYGLFYEQPAEFLVLLNF